MLGVCSMQKVKLMEKVPDFTRLDQHENWIKLSELRGNKVILYFYPKDNTPG